MYKFIIPRTTQVKTANTNLNTKMSIVIESVTDVVKKIIINFIKVASLYILAQMFIGPIVLMCCLISKIIKEIQEFKEDPLVYREKINKNIIKFYGIMNNNYITQNYTITNIYENEDEYEEEEEEEEKTPIIGNGWCNIDVNNIINNDQSEQAKEEEEEEEENEQEDDDVIEADQIVDQEDDVSEAEANANANANEEDQIVASATEDAEKNAENMNE